MAEVISSSCHYEQALLKFEASRTPATRPDHTDRVLRLIASYTHRIVFLRGIQRALYLNPTRVDTPNREIRLHVPPRGNSRERVETSKIIADFFTPHRFLLLNSVKAEVSPAQVFALSMVVSFVGVKAWSLAFLSSEN